MTSSIYLISIFYITIDYICFFVDFLSLKIITGQIFGHLV
jgi:hypothetical protein